MMNKIEILFKDKVLQRGGINLYSKYDALKFIEECEKEAFSILGIDGFYITDDTTEPSIENSIDFSVLSLNNENVFSIAKEFLDKQQENLFFEIIYEEKE